MTKPDSPYDFDTNDVAVEIARQIRTTFSFAGMPPLRELTALIEKKLDAMVVDGKIRTYQKKHHVVS